MIFKLKDKPLFSNFSNLDNKRKVTNNKIKELKQEIKMLREEVKKLKK